MMLHEYTLALQTSAILSIVSDPLYKPATYRPVNYNSPVADIGTHRNLQIMAENVPLYSSRYGESHYHSWGQLTKGLSQALSA